MPWLAGCPSDSGQAYGALVPIACVLHRTYGQWPGDYSVIKNNGLAHFLLGQQDGQWVQFADTNRVEYHCNGANFKAVGIEITGVNTDPLTTWQLGRLGEILQFLHAAHGVPLNYTDPISVAPASVWVNSGDFRGVISHVSVRTDDGSAQHTDMVTADDYARAVGGALPAPGPTPASRRVNPKMWIAWVLDQNWCDCYYNGVIVEAWKNDDEPSVFGIGTKFKRYLDGGAAWTAYKTTAEYAAVRDRLKAAAAA